MGQHRRSRADDLALALELADLADAISMGRFRAADLEVHRKVDGSVATEVDVGIERAMRDHLARGRPRDAIVGEELGALGSGPRVWTIDPIDGTVAFVEGIRREWATLICLVEDDNPVVGVVSRPAIGRRWWAAAGLGAFSNGGPIRVAPTPELGSAVISEDFRVSIGRNLDTNPLAALAVRCAGVHPWVDGFELLRVAEGRVDLFVNWHGKTGPDLHAPVCILREAGGRFSDLSGGIDVHAPVQIATNGPLHDEVLGIVTELIAACPVDPMVEPTEDVPAIWRARADQPGAAQALDAIDPESRAEEILEGWRRQGAGTHP